MKKLLFTKPELFLPKKIAIVGNSGILTSSKYGKLIDSFDCIVRFNRGPTIGFEEDVGSKTNIYVVNNHNFTNNKMDGSGWEDASYSITQPQFFVKNLKNMCIYCIGVEYLPSPIDSLIEQHTDTSSKVFYLDYGKEQYIKNKFGFKKDPGVGICFIALCILSGIGISLFGIDMTNRRHDHYWEEVPNIISPCHDIPNEKVILEKLCASEKVHINV